MEHRLILGGEQYLPFARSCVTKLKKLGLPYASQSFEVDGVSIKVRIEPGHEYIRLEGGACQLSMDSGVVDVYPIFGPNILNPGVFQDTDATKAYTAGFTEAHKKGEVNPSKGNSGQAAGEVTVSTSGNSPHIRGYISTEGIGSFQPSTVEATPATYPPTFVASKDGNMFGKKYTATFCPSSIFTGKTRLYVQAMYGLPLYKYGTDGSTTMSFPVPVRIAEQEGSCPALWLTPYVARDDFKSGVSGELNYYQDVMLDTSSGVHLDEDGNHWLININNAKVWVYKLISNACGEKLRKLILPTSPLAQDEKDRIETYILAYSLPDSKHLKFPDCGVPANYSMGYGWHWNWSGTEAVITVSYSYQLDVGVSEEVARNFGMKSTTYKIAVTRTVLPKPEGGYKDHTQQYEWKATSSTFIPETAWAVGRIEICIVEPLWGTESLIKSTPKYSAGAPRSSGAVFYSYYDKDTLQNCRVNSRFVGRVEEIWSASERFVGFNSGGAKEVQGWTLGANGGYSDRKYAVAEHTMNSVTIGSFTTAEVTYGYTEMHDKDTVSGKSLNERMPRPDSPVNGWGTPREDARYAEGYPDANGTYRTVFFPGSSSPSSGYRVDGSWTERITTEYYLYSGSIQVVIPLYDSQAALVNYKYAMHEDTVGINRTWTQNGLYSGGFMDIGVVSDNSAHNEYDWLATPPVLVASYPSNFTTIVTYGWALAEAGNPYFPSTDVAIRTIQDTILAEGCKACVGGHVVDAKFTHLYEFTAQDIEEIGTSFRTVSSATGRAFQGNNIPTPTGMTALAVPAFVGYS